MADGEMERAVGRLEGKVAELQTTIERNREAHERAYSHLTEQFDTLLTEISGIKSAQDRVKGGWAMLTVLGGVAAAVGGLIQWMASHLTVH